MLSFVLVDIYLSRGGPEGVVDKTNAPKGCHEPGPRQQDATRTVRIVFCFESRRPRELFEKKLNMVLLHSTVAGGAILTKTISLPPAFRPLGASVSMYRHSKLHEKVIFVGAAEHTQWNMDDVVSRHQTLVGAIRLKHCQ